MNTWADENGRLRLAWRFVLGVLLILAANYLAGGIANAAARSQRSFEVVFFPTLVALLLASSSAMLLFADGVDRNPIAAIGLGRQGAIFHSLFGVLTGVIAIGVAMAAIAGWGSLSFGMRINTHTLALLLVEVFILATAAMSEELMFRGYPFQRLLEGAGPVVAIIVLSFFFGLAHLKNPHAGGIASLSLFNTVFVGVLLAFAYLRVRNLWLPWGVHFGWNATLGVVFGLPVSGLNEFSVVVHGRATGPVWLTGGAYGIEGGVAGTLGIAVAFLPVYWVTRRVQGRHQQDSRDLSQ